MKATRLILALFDIQTYDSTLRDRAQPGGINSSLEDKLAGTAHPCAWQMRLICHAMDELMRPIHACLRKGFL